MADAVRIIPVLDVLGGLAVHAVAGNREHYRPLASRWCDNADPIAVATAMRQRFGFEQLYLADLDAILGQPPNLPLYAGLQALGFRLWVDAGIRTAEDAVRLADSLQSDGANALQSNQSSGMNETPLSPACNDLASPRNLEGGGEGMGVRGKSEPRASQTPLTPSPLPPPSTSLQEDNDTDCGGRGVGAPHSAWVHQGKKCKCMVLVVGLETIASPAELASTVHQLGPDRLAFSLDMKNGRPLGEWGDLPIEVANQAISVGVRRVIVLDLARVGVGSGLGTEQLLAELSRQHPQVELIAGGGVRGRADLERLRKCGASAALVGTALHKGTLP